MNRKLARLCLLTSIFILLSSCDLNTASKRLPETLIVGLLPDESEEALISRYTPLFEYISKQLGIKYQFKFSNSYADHLRQFEAGDIHLAYFGGFTFIQAQHSVNAEPVVMRDIDLNFTSVFVANKNISAANLQDLKGKTFSFGSRLSTSGHLMPRYFMKEKKINAEDYFSRVEYSGAHDTTAINVNKGLVDSGVANSKIIKKMIAEGHLKNIDIVWQTPPYPDYVWAIQSGFVDSELIKLRNAFMSLNVSDREHAEILGNVDAQVFFPASVDDFNRLKTVADELKMFESDKK